MENKRRFQVTTFFPISLLLILILLLFGNCNSNNPPDKITIDKSVSCDTLSNTVGDSSITTKAVSPEIFLFKYSECKHDCNELSRMITQKRVGDRLYLSFGLIENCIGKFIVDVKSDEETINLNIRIKPKYFKNRNGHIDTIVVVTNCDCYFLFEIGLKNVPENDQKILINGHELSYNIQQRFKYIQNSFYDIPEFPGEADSLRAFISKHLIYPKAALMNQIEGTVYVEGEFDSHGKLIQAKIIRGINPELDAEAIRLTSIMPDWILSENNPSNENRAKFPIRFQLQEYLKNHARSRNNTNLFHGQIVYETTEKPAQFVGGEEARMIFLKENLHVHKQEDVQESLHATFIIDTTGSIHNISIKDQLYSDGLTPLETEFIRVINRMPKWIPAEQNGKKVCSRVQLPLKIHLNDCNE